MNAGTDKVIDKRTTTEEIMIFLKENLSYHKYEFKKRLLGVDSLERKGATQIKERGKFVGEDLSELYSDKLDVRHLGLNF